MKENFKKRNLVIKGEGQLPVSESRRTWQCGPCISGFRVKVPRKDLRNIPLNLRKLAETGGVPVWMSREIFMWSSEDKPWVFLQCLDIKDFRMVGYLSRRAVKRVWDQPKREKCAVVNKAQSSWRSKEYFDIRLEMQSLYFALLVSGLIMYGLMFFSLCSPSSLSEFSALYHSMCWI